MTEQSPYRARQFANALADYATEHALAARHDCLVRDYAKLMADFSAVKTHPHTGDK